VRDKIRDDKDNDENQRNASALDQRGRRGPGARLNWHHLRTRQARSPRDWRPWARDLTKDLGAIAAWNAKAVVTLIEPHEFFCSPYPVSVPRFSVVAWNGCICRPAHSKRLRQRLDAGENIVVHCRGGLGRAGMVSARLLVESGIEPEAAMERVRAARPGAIETPRQEEWVRSGSPRSSKPRHERFQP
jgi:hypothetical protein